MKRRKRRRQDIWKTLVQAPIAGPSYFPMVGYLHADRSVSEYTLASGMSWHSFDRAVSSCFGSAARRLRGLRSHGSNQSPIVAILMCVLSDGHIVWKHKFTIPAAI